MVRDTRTSDAELPPYDIPIMCPTCIHNYGVSPVLRTHPNACIYQFGYEQQGRVWRVFFCCERRAAQFLEALGEVAETVKLEWRRDAQQ